MRRLIVVLACVAGCTGSDSVFAQANLPRSIEFQGTGSQSYLATMVVPAVAVPVGDARLAGVHFDIPGVYASVFAGGTPGVRSACKKEQMADVRDVHREKLADGDLVVCRQADGMAGVREIRMDNSIVVYEFVTHTEASDADLVIATNMAKSLTLSWHADNKQSRFRFPCHGELLFEKNAAGEGTWMTHLQCPPEAPNSLP